jgi:hypothetical protein
MLGDEGEVSGKIRAHYFSAVDVARLPMKVGGYGHIKEKAAQAHPIPAVFSPQPMIAPVLKRA